MMGTVVVLEMPKPAGPDKGREEKKSNPRGIYEKPRGSGRWWIRYADATGRIRRERAPSKGTAITLYQKRKTEVLQGRKLPETMRQPAASFKQIAEEAIADIERRYRRPADDVARLRTAIDWFGTREAGSLTPGEIEAKLNAMAAAQEWAASTINHYRSVMSLAYRIAKRDGKVQKNPVRDVPHQQENNNRVRSLTADEERRLRTVIRRSYPSHEDEFDFALNTGLRQEEWGAADSTAQRFRYAGASARARSLGGDRACLFVGRDRPALELPETLVREGCVQGWNRRFPLA